MRLAVVVALAGLVVAGCASAPRASRELRANYAQPAPAPAPRTAALSAPVRHAARPMATAARLSPARAAAVRTAAPRPASVAPQPQPSPVWGWGCDDAARYFTQHGNPAFRFECPGSGFGGQAGTCPDLPGWCTGYVVSIRVPCPVAYMNEASNSWTWRQWLNYPNDQRYAHGLDPYGRSC